MYVHGDSKRADKPKLYIFEWNLLYSIVFCDFKDDSKTSFNKSTTGLSSNFSNCLKCDIFGIKIRKQLTFLLFS